MPLQLICGRSHSGKSTYIINIIKKLIQQNRKIILVVPEQFAHIAEMRLLRHVGRILDDFIEITSFNRLAMRTRDMVDEACENIISPTGKSLVMSQVLEDCELEYYKNISDLPGFVDVCLDSISEFKKYNISYEQLDDVAHNVDNDLLAMKLRDLNSLYQSYDKASENQFIDSDDVLDILYNTLCTHDMYSDCVFLFDEFSTFIPQEERIISQLINQAQQVYITLCMDRDLTNTLFLPSVTTYNRLVDICREEHFDLQDTIWLDKTYYTCDLVSFAEANLFSYPTRKYSGDISPLKLVKAKNPYNEVDNAARYIIHLVRDCKLRYKDICIICSDINQYNHIFYNIFARYDIPFFMDEKTPVLRHHIVVFVLNILDVYLNNYSYESIFNFLKSGFNDINAEQISTLENFILKTNITKNAWLSDERWNTIIANYTSASAYDVDVINRIRNDYILPLAQFHDAIKGRNAACDSAKKLYAYLCSIDLPSAISSYVKSFDKQNDLVRKKEYESVWNVL
ncbi:MAG: exodeoxyribonuclease V subunit gamma, partial [Clostridia bacterium]|nr:exodeoxyribonuclease V subunit gamma [Clostridia bacterium]